MEAETQVANITLHAIRNVIEGSDEEKKAASRQLTVFDLVFKKNSTYQPSTAPNKATKPALNIRNRDGLAVLLIAR